MSWIVERTDADGVTRFQVRFRDGDGVKRTAGTYASRREALRAGRRSDGKVEDGTWINPASGRVSFRDYVEGSWWPSRHLEVSTRAAYRSYLDCHFLPYFGHRAMSAITPSTVQAWVTQARQPDIARRSRRAHTLGTACALVGTDVVRPQSPRGLAGTRRGGARAGRRASGVGGGTRPGRTAARSRGIQPRRAYRVRFPRRRDSSSALLTGD